ncbi:MAG TPA: glycosyltransferase, partial [Firmicutes bacterium]|nr:glycosyltransferase [Bacillota bacterium]
MPDSPRVALFIPSLYGGGVRRVMVNLARGLVQEGLPVDMVLTRAEGPYLSQLPPRVRVVDLKSRRVGLAVPALIRYLRRTRPKALLSAMEHTNLAALIAKSLSGVPVRVVVSVHAMYSREVELFPHRQNRALIPFLVRRLYPHASTVVAVSESVAADLAAAAGLPREKIKVIYNPVVTSHLREQLQEPLNHPWFGPEEPPVILSAGRLTEEKDFLSLIQAFHLLR